ncbi:hypothetical protein TBLA_0B05750 [Henningerozyma blattae CBS 6284]|uniref:Uncharacterized protein n=1 Tax=Henningerozyma blattae (strain ATCC 34711 / CBS 6284 / DSM 70876 / NBRC 10599 / NRRL Y-10934 / UCD 77-7) TaxID=1071380 RepID=I2GZ50_HENB6|nr:hypothetical protein TBLA_0B05750 [Tetrapisispora blattae CBS 6284]CCH59402.1 hypothetical protein TBLA_0B05750 [Tetrapisispora blattae CBS 6284]
MNSSCNDNINTVNLFNSKLRNPLTLNEGIKNTNSQAYLSYNPIESKFLHNTDYLEKNPQLDNHRPKEINAVPIQRQHFEPHSATNESNNADLSSQWIQEFSNIKVKDPLEFDDSYKKLYAQYENSQRSSNTMVLQNKKDCQLYRNINKQNFHHHMVSKLGYSNTNSQLDQQFNNQFKLVESQLANDLKLNSSSRIDKKPELSASDKEFQQIATEITGSLMNYTEEDISFETKKIREFKIYVFNAKYKRWNSCISIN